MYDFSWLWRLFAPAGGDDSQRSKEPSREDVPVFELTSAAADKVREIVREGQESRYLPNETLYVRLRVVVGGFAGYLFKVDLDPAPDGRDYVFETRGVLAVVAANQAGMLRGSRIDYHDRGEQSGFDVRCPNFEGEDLGTWLPILQAQRKME